MAAFALPAAASADCTIPDADDPTIDGRPGLQRQLRHLAAGLVRADPVQRARGDDRRSGSATATTSPRARAATPSTSASTSRSSTPTPSTGRPSSGGWSGSAVKDLAIAENGYSPPDVYEHEPTARPMCPATRPVPTSRARSRPAVGGRARLAAIVGPPNDPDGIDWRSGRDQHEPAGPTIPTPASLRDTRRRRLGW